ncbi:MAG: hypothetical protein ACR2LM_20030 [Pyrinomonadaceae bacterium]
MSVPQRGSVWLSWIADSHADGDWRLEIQDSLRLIGYRQSKIGNRRRPPATAWWY